MTRVRLIVMLTIGLLGASEARAADFDMVMSQDQALCEQVLTALNSDLATHGELRLAEHPAIPAIRWRPMKALGSPLKNTDGVQFRWARFDFNNDGVEELVVKRSAPVRQGAMVQAGTGVPADDLYIFSARDTALTRVQTWIDFGKAFAKSGIGMLELGGYHLRDTAAGFDDRFGDELIVNPFRYRGTTYYHVDQIMPMTSMTRMHLVITYKGKLYSPGSQAVFSDEIQKEVQDACYLKRSISLKEIDPLHRSADGLIIRP